MSPAPPAPSWPVPSAVAFGTSDSFPELVVPLTFNLFNTANIELPESLTWSEIEFAIPDGVPTSSTNSQGWPSEITSYGVKVTSLKALSNLDVGIVVNVEGSTAESWTVNISF